MYNKIILFFMKIYILIIFLKLQLKKCVHKFLFKSLLVIVQRTLSICIYVSACTTGKLHRLEIIIPLSIENHVAHNLIHTSKTFTYYFWVINFVWWKGLNVQYKLPWYAGTIQHTLCTQHRPARCLMLLEFPITSSQAHMTTTPI